MTNLNLLKVKTLITTSEVLFHAPIVDEPEVRLLMQSILIAERRFIKPMIGYAVYDDLVDSKNEVVTALNAAELTALLVEAYPNGPFDLKPGDLVNSDSFLDAEQLLLWRNYLHKITAECVYFCSLPTQRSRLTKAGLMQENPRTQVGTGGATTVDLKDLKHLMDSALQDRISPLIDDMHAYLCLKKWPGYTRSCGCDESGEPQTRRTPIILSLYDDDDENCGCRKSINGWRT